MVMAAKLSLTIPFTWKMHSAWRPIAVLWQYALSHAGLFENHQEIIYESPKMIVLLCVID